MTNLNFAIIKYSNKTAFGFFNSEIYYNLIPGILTFYISFQISDLYLDALRFAKRTIIQCSYID